MRVKNISIPKLNISFGTNRRCYNVEATNGEVYTQTEVNRKDLDFKQFAQLILRDFNDCPKPQIYVMACSDGSEPYTLAMYLNELDSEGAKKFLPIKATDMDPVILSYAKQYKLNMTQDDLIKLRDADIDYQKYFKKFTPYTMQIQQDKLERMVKTYDVCDFLKESVDFSQKTILQQVVEMDKNERKIICCRNVMPYLGGASEILHHLCKISEKMQKGDIFVLGNFDRNIKTLQDLEHLGMEEVQHNVFKKVK